MSKCKFCGADELDRCSVVKDFECGTYHVESSGDAGWAQDVRCEVRCKKRDRDELARFRAMFPVLPWDDSPITPQVCELLGMEHDKSRPSEWCVDGILVYVFEYHGASVFVEGYEISEETTAGKLACLVAARRKQD